MGQLIYYTNTFGITVQRAEILIFHLHSQNNYLRWLEAL